MNIACLLVKIYLADMTTYDYMSRQQFLDLKYILWGHPYTTWSNFSEILTPLPPSWSNMVIWPTPSINPVVNPGPPPQHHPQKFHKYLYTFYYMLIQLHSYPKICHVTAQIENSRNHFLI